MTDTYPYTSREYFNAVESIARNAFDECHHDPDHEDIHDRIREAVDGSQWVIYTGRQRAVLVWTENLEAADDVGVRFDTVTDALNGIAFYAMEADVRDALQRISHDHDPETCEACRKRTSSEDDTTSDT